MVDMNALIAANDRRWQRARVVREFSSVARRLVAAPARLRYQSVAARTGVPWWFIAVVHERECGQDWTGSLAQGDRWDRVSSHVPAGRGPFASWEDAAVDALENCAPFAARNLDWSAGALLTKLEEYNGLGYARRGVPSPYVWAGTDQYVAGKYVRDKVYDSATVDRQLGCAGLLRAMMALDPGIRIPGTTSSMPAPRRGPAAAPPAPNHHSKPNGLIALIRSKIAAILERTSP